MTPQAAAALRCPVCGGALGIWGRTLRCAKNHSFDMAKEGYVNLLPIQKRHAADPGDGKAMVAARRAFLQSGAYDPFRNALGDLCARAGYAAPHIVDAGCGEGSYDRTVLDTLTAAGQEAQLIGFDLSKPAVRLAAKLVPQAAFAVGGSFCAPVADGWADILLNVFSPFAAAEFSRMLRPGGLLLVNSDLARPDRVYRDDIVVVKVPANETAAEIGNTRGTNIVMLGAMSEASPYFDKDYMRGAIDHYFAKKGKVNAKNAVCFDRGAEIAAEQLKKG